MKRADIRDLLSQSADIITGDEAVAIEYEGRVVGHYVPVAAAVATDLTMAPSDEFMQLDAGESRPTAEALTSSNEPAPVSDARSEARSLTLEDSLWSIVGIGRSDDSADVAANKHRYLSEANEDREG